MTKLIKREQGMFPSNQHVEVEIYDNGDLEYLTPL